MAHRTLCWCCLLTVTALGATARAQSVEQEVDSNGVVYQVTRQPVQRVLNETRYEDRKYVTTRDRYTTEMQEVTRTYMVPITEQQWVPGYQRTLNIFAPPVPSYRLLPVTRWEQRVETVRVPVTRRETIPEEHMQQVQVVSPRVVQGEIVSRVPIGLRSNGLAAAPGGTQLKSDPPREGSTAWQPADRSAR